MVSVEGEPVGSGIKTLSDLLRRGMYCEDSSIKYAEEAAANNGTFLGDELLQIGLAEQTLATCLSFLHDAPVIDLETLKPPEAEVLALIPPELARDREILPLTLLSGGEDTLLRVAMRNPGDQDTLKQIQEAVDPSIRVRPVVALRGLVLAIETAYPNQQA